YQRMPLFSDDRAVDLLRSAIRSTRENHPFRLDAAVILPDHLHMIWTLPEADIDYPTRWRLIKSHFSRHWTGDPREKLSPSRAAKGERAIWQRRYWEHSIQNDDDLRRHLDYIHYNPVKHGLVHSPGEWKHSSFHQFVSQGLYLPEWGRNDSLLLDFEPGWE
ncbi:MAG: transposase, partial [Anaerolineaceae bacterium]|nr:transposase [Anaerolineaceae bacterium]